MALISLPEYDIERIVTGQSIRQIRGKDKDVVYKKLWLVEIAENDQVADGPCDGPRPMEPFFLHWYPAESGGLASHRKRHGFNSHTFWFHDHDFEHDGRCLAMIPFPGYDVERIRTGQSNQRRNIWASGFSPGGG